MNFKKKENTEDKDANEIKCIKLYDIQHDMNLAKSCLQRKKSWNQEQVWTYAIKM